MKATYRKPRQRRERHGGSASKPSKTLVLHRHRCPQAHLRCSEGRGGHRSGSEPVVLGGVLRGLLGGLGWEPMGWILWVRQVPGYHTGCGSMPSGACVWVWVLACCLLPIPSSFHDGGVSSSLVTEVSHIAWTGQSCAGRRGPLSFHDRVCVCVCVCVFACALWEFRSVRTAPLRVCDM